MRKILAGLIASTCLASPALAQSTVFRVPVTAPAPASTATPVNMWLQSVGACSTTCGTGTRTTTYQCQDAMQPDTTSGGFGPAEPDAQCVATLGAKPADTSATCSNYSGCSFDWVRPPEVVTQVTGVPGCGTVRRQFQPVCRRADGTVMASADHALCRNDMPDYNDVAANVDGALGYDRTTTESGSCTPPAWEAGAWGSYSSTCSSSATRTRSVVCKNSSGVVQPDASCTAPKPATSETTGVYSSCGYSSVAGPWSAWSSTCSASATRTRGVSCVRSDGATVPASDCTAAGVTMDTASETSAQYGGCSNSWQTGGWSAWSSTCSATATQTRAVWCERSDGTTVADASCAGPKPAASQTSAQYGGCGYSWQNGAWSAWSSTCSASAVQTRSVWCQQSDGTVTADANCASAGAKPATSQTSAQYGGCGYSWQASGWSGWSSSCSASATRTRSVWCQQSDGQVVGDPSCGGGKPATSETSAQYGGCGYSWQTGGWSGYNSTCSSAATRTRAVWCQQSDGAVVGDASCGGGRPASSETTGVYSGCGYTPSYGAWSSCTAGSQSRTVTCTRSDGAQVPTSNCGVAGDATTESQGCTEVRDSNWCYSGALTRSPATEYYLDMACSGSGTCSSGGYQDEGYMPRDQFAGTNANSGGDNSVWSYDPNYAGNQGPTCKRAWRTGECTYKVDGAGNTSDHKCYSINVSVGQ